MVITGIELNNVYVCMSHADAALIVEVLHRATTQQLVEASGGAKEYGFDLMGNDALAATLSFERTVGRTVREARRYLQQCVEKMGEAPAEPTPTGMVQ